MNRVHRFLSGMALIGLCWGCQPAPPAPQRSSQPTVAVQAQLDRQQQRIEQLETDLDLALARNHELQARCESLQTLANRQAMLLRGRDQVIEDLGDVVRQRDALLLEVERLRAATQPSGETP